MFCGVGLVYVRMDCLVYMKVREDKVMSNSSRVHFTKQDFNEKRFVRLSGQNGMQARPFLQEKGRLKQGQVCNFFGITNFQIEKENVKIEAELLFADKCQTIKAWAELVDINCPQKPIQKFEIQQTDNSYAFEYQISASLQNDVVRKEIGIMVYAQWESESEPHGAAVITEGMDYDVVNYEHIHPKKQSSYVVFPDPSTVDLTYPEAVQKDDGHRDDHEEIVISLFRKPEDTRDLDYLCLYGKRPGTNEPFIMVPGQGNINFVDARIDTASVETICYLMPVDRDGGIQIAAVGGPEYENGEIELSVTDRSIHYEMLKPWSDSFKESGDYVNHHFIYSLIFKYRHIGENRYHFLYITNKDVRENYIYKIPGIIIKWGCLDENTLIGMADGREVAIKFIRIGDYVVSPDGEPIRVLNIWSGRENESYWLRTEFGDEIRASVTHPFLTRDGWKMAKDLRPGDMVKMGGYYKEAGFAKLMQVEKKEEVIRVCNLSLQRNVMIANGFVCGDIELQNQMERN